MINKRIFLITILLSGVTACQSTPRGPAPASVSSVPRSYDITDVNIGQEFVWGGEILEISNLKNTTELTVLGYPLDKHRQPNDDDTSTGRFIAVYSGFLEPTDYRKGRLVSVAGKLTEIRNGKIDSADYEFPVLSIDNLNLHKRKPKGVNLPFSIGIGIGIHK